VEKEHRLLLDQAAQVMTGAGVSALFQRLKRINATLWDIEDAIRQQEEAVRFGPEFVALARSVYFTNDERAAIKRAINELLASDLMEEKSYHEGRQDEQPLSIAPSKLSVVTDPGSHAKSNRLARPRPL